MESIIEVKNLKKYYKSIKAVDGVSFDVKKGEIVAILGPQLKNAMLAIGIINVPRFARIVRSSVLSIKESEYISAAKALGAGSPGIK